MAATAFSWERASSTCRARQGVPGVRVLYITRENREGLFRLLERDFCR